MPDARQMLEIYSESLPPSCRRVYVGAADRFLRFAAGDLSRDKLLAYIHRLLKQGYSPNSVRRFDVVILRGLYRSNGIPWPLKRWELPQVRESDVFAPALDPSLIGRMVRAARAGLVSPEGTALLAVSTTFGLRRGEMARLGPADVDLGNRLLHVATLKRGRERVHLIPAVIVPYLQRGPWGRLTPRQVSEYFYEVEAAAGIGRLRECGWHGIRRALVRGLVEAGVPEVAVRNFLRWKRSETDMLARYYSTTVLTEGGSYLDTTAEDRQVDEAVFRVHPFLPMWEG